MVKYGLGWIETVDNDVKQLVENVWNFLKTVQNGAKCGRELGTTSGNTLGDIHGHYEMEQRWTSWGFTRNNLI